MEKYTATLKDGREIYVPTWPASVALQNLTSAGKYIGTTNLLAISELNIPSVILAITEAEDAQQTTALIKHFVCGARIEGQKLTEGQFDSEFEGNIYVAAELFAHVIKAQYADFFEQGLAKEISQES